LVAQQETPLGLVIENFSTCIHLKISFSTYIHVYPFLLRVSIYKKKVFVEDKKGIQKVLLSKVEGEN